MFSESIIVRPQIPVVDKSISVIGGLVYVAGQSEGVVGCAESVVGTGFAAIVRLIPRLLFFLKRS